MMVDDLPAQARGWVEAFNSHDPDATVRQLAPDGTFEDPVTDGPVQREELQQYVRETCEAFPDIHIDPHECYEDGDAVVIEIEYSGTFEGAFEGVPPTGEHGVINAVIVMDLGDEGIESIREYWDQEAFREELGLTFPTILRHAPRLIGGKLKRIA